EKALAFALDDVDDRYDVRMPHERSDARFVAEHVVELAVVEKVAVNAFEHDDVLEARRAHSPRDVDRRHAARRELEQRLVVAEPERRMVDQKTPPTPLHVTNADSFFFPLQSVKIASTPVTTARPIVTPMRTFVRVCIERPSSRFFWVGDLSKV